MVLLGNSKDETVPILRFSRLIILKRRTRLHSSTLSTN